MKRLLDFHQRHEEGETMEQRLEIIENRQRDGSFAVSVNGRVRLPVEFLTAHGLSTDGQRVYMYLNRRKDLVVSVRDYRVKE